MKKKIRDIIENLGWNVYEGETDIELEKYSPLGEDFIFSIGNNGNIVEQVIDYAENFDTNEHAEMYINIRGERGVPNSIKDLIEDAEDIKQMLLELANELKKETEKKDKKYYVEITDWDNIGEKNEVIMSSELFDTREECLNWASKVKKLASNYSINLITIDIYNNRNDIVEVENINYILKGE